MRHFLTLVISVLVISTTCGQELKLYNSIGTQAHYQIERYTGYYFDVSLDLPSQSCSNVEIKITLPLGIIYTRLNSLGFTASQSNNIVTIKNEVSNPIIDGAFRINLTAQILNDGSVCENTPLNVTATID